MTTVGEMVDRRGPCEPMVAVAELAESRGRIPVGLWDVDGLPDGWRVLVNGTREIQDGVPPWNVRVDRNGWPVASFDAAGGTVIGDCEDAIIAMLRAAAALKVKLRGKG